MGTGLAERGAARLEQLKQEKERKLREVEAELGIRRKPKTPAKD
jgi:hypothetical protein